ncbi:MAG: hypothetical protein CMQ24_20250 [Gammaproteobacteria bacterium]|nr:hypothetical protein [Gammaproteobacteria bacterium]
MVKQLRADRSSERTPALAGESGARAEVVGACRFCETVRLLGSVTVFAAAAAYIVLDQMGLLGRAL